MENTNSHPLLGKQYAIERSLQDCFYFEVISANNTLDSLSNESVFDSFTPIFYNTSKRDTANLIQCLEGNDDTVLFDSKMFSDWIKSEDPVSKTIIPVSKNVSLTFQLYEIPFFSKAMHKRMEEEREFYSGFEIGNLLKNFWSKEKAISFAQYIKENKVLLDDRLMGDWLLENKDRFS